MGMEWTVRGLVLLHLIWNFDVRGRLLAGFPGPRSKACSNITSNGEFRLMLLPIPAKQKHCVHEYQNHHRQVVFIIDPSVDAGRSISSQNGYCDERVWHVDESRQTG